MGRREKLALIFRDTERLYQTNPRLHAVVEESRARARLYLPGEPLELPARIGPDPIVTVSGSKSFDAALRLLDENPSSHVAVLNFASATNPGGGVLCGSSAQEESLCRCSTLYPTLDQRRFWKGYYQHHRDQCDVRYSDACIYSPGVVVFKCDAEYPKLMPEDEWFEVDVVTCAAPNLRRMSPGSYDFSSGSWRSVSDEELYRLHVSRGRRICEVAAANGATSMVLGAFGCGAFQNDPRVVARAYRTVLEEMGPFFERVEFAVFCPSGRESKNFEAFKETFK